MRSRPVRLAPHAVAATALAATTALVAAPAQAATSASFAGGVLTVSLGSPTGFVVMPYGSGYSVTSDEGITSLPGCGKDDIDQWHCTGVTKVVVTGTSGADYVSVEGDFLVEARLGAGDDELYAESTRKVTAYTEAGADRVLLSNHNNLANIQAAHIDGGDGDDWIVGGSGGDTLIGGSGNDEIAGGAGNDSIQGGEGADKLFGGRFDKNPIDGGDGDDVLDGGGGDDLMYGGLGADVFNGGAGVDTVDYDNAYDFNVTRVFNASLDGIANDGVSGEGDNIGADGGVENLFIDAYGTFNPMTVVGNDAANTITGAPSGTVSVDLRGGNDSFVGGASDGGTISVVGGAGDDRITTWGKEISVDGGTGADMIKTQDGDSTVTGGPGSDSIITGAGNDTINSRDGEVDSISCGIGADTLIGDSHDVVNADPLAFCESQDLAAAVAGEVEIAIGARTKVSKKGVAKFKVANGLTNSVTVKAIVKSTKPKLRAGVRKATIKAGAKGAIKVKLSKKAFRLLKRKGKLKVVVTVRIVSGAQGKVTRKTVLKR
ncbi:MAG: calcium-binding protein [Nocardioides sp.]